MLSLPCAPWIPKIRLMEKIQKGRGWAHGSGHEGLRGSPTGSGRIGLGILRIISYSRTAVRVSAINGYGLCARSFFLLSHIRGFARFGLGNKHTLCVVVW